MVTEMVSNPRHHFSNLHDALSLVLGVPLFWTGKTEVQWLCWGAHTGLLHWVRAGVIMAFVFTL